MVGDVSGSKDKTTLACLIKGAVIINNRLSLIVL